MHDILTRVSFLKRPRLLIRAARFGADDYDRTVHLRQIIGSDALPGPGEALMRLMEIEAETEAQRREARGRYIVSRHVEQLIAIIAETRLLRARRETA